MKRLRVLRGILQGLTLAATLSGCFSQPQFSFSVLGELEFGKMVGGQFSKMALLNLDDPRPPIFGTISKRMMYVRNTGDVSGKILGIRLNPPSLGDHFKFVPQCPESLPGGGVPCPIEITAAPLTVGPLSGTLALSYDDGKGQVFDATLEIKVTVSDAAVLYFELAEMNMSPARINLSSEATLNVKSNGILAKARGVTIQNAYNVKAQNFIDSQFSVVEAGTTCKGTLNLNDNPECQVKVRFTPTTEGTFDPFLQINYSGGLGPESITSTLHATGQSVIHLPNLVKAGDLNFNNVVRGDSVTANLTLNLRSIDNAGASCANVEPEHLVITGPSAAKGYSIDSTDVSATRCLINAGVMQLPGGCSCTIKVKFEPGVAATLGATPDTMTFQWDSSQGLSTQTMTVNLAANVITPAKLRLAAPAGTYNFGTIYAHQTASAPGTTFQIQNDGQYSTTVTGVVGAAGYPAPTFATCAGLGLNATCFLGASSFAPTVAGNPINGSYTLTYRTGVGMATDTLVIPVQGVSQPDLYVTSAPAHAAVIDFGNVVIDSVNSASPSTAQTVTLNFYGTEGLSAGSFSVDASTSLVGTPFRIRSPGLNGAGVCGASARLGGDSCTFSFEIYDLTTSNATANTVINVPVQINYASGKSFSYTLRVTPRAAPSLAVTSVAPVTVPVRDFGTVTIKDSSSFYLDYTLTNQSAYVSIPAGTTAVIKTGGTDTDQFAVTNNCSGVIAANGTCVVRVLFSPTTLLPQAAKAGELYVTYSNRVLPAVAQVVANTNAFPFTGTATNNILIKPIAASTLNYGNFFANSVRTLTRTASLNVYGPTGVNWTQDVSGVSAELALSQNNCVPIPATPTPACTYNAVLDQSLVADPSLDATPVRSKVYRSANLSIPYSDGAGGSGSMIFAFTGSTVYSRKVEFTSTSSTVTFPGPIYEGSTTPVNFTRSVSFYGLDTWAVDYANSSAAALPAGITMNQGTCGTTERNVATLAPTTSTTCNITFTLDPTGKPAGVYAPTFDMAYTNPVFPMATYPAKRVRFTFNYTITANSSNVTATVGAYTGSISKIIVGRTTDADVTLANAAGATSSATLTSLPSTVVSGEFYRVENTNAGYCKTDAPATVLAPGQSCKIQMRFAPSAMGARNSGVFTVGYNDGTAKTKTFSMSGTGTQQIRFFAGGYNSCMLNENGKLVCWGLNDTGQLAQGNPGSFAYTSVPAITALNFPSGVEIQDVAVGEGHICALVTTGSGANPGQVTCWGNNDSGQLGLALADSYIDSIKTNPDTTLKVVNLGGTGRATQISVGASHSCALMSDGAIKCWGSNIDGRLGHVLAATVGGAGDPMGDNLRAVSSLPLATSVSAGFNHTCAVLASGGTRCWGGNGYGQLGLQRVKAQLPSASSPMTELTDIALGAAFGPVTQVIASPGVSTCAVANGGLKCFGKAFVGAATASSTGAFNGVLGQCWVRNVYDSVSHACTPANLADTNYQLASHIGDLDGDLGDRVPVVNFGGPTVVDLKVGLGFGCVTLSNGELRCWGYGTRGQLGNGGLVSRGQTTAEMAALVPVALNLGTATLSSYGVGQEHGCAVLSDNKVKCWGSALNNANGRPSNQSSSSWATPVTIYDGAKAGGTP